MDNLKAYQAIKETVQSNLPGSRLVLFGSRARGDHDRFSDYDLLIITATNFTAQEKVHWSTRIDKAIIKAIKVPIDLLISSEEEVKWQCELPGHIVRTALREGIAL